MKRQRDEGYYTIEDRKLPSVTTILGILGKPALIQWAAKEAAGYVKEWTVDKLLSGDMTIEQLRELDIALLMKEAKARHKALKEKAADLGSRVHDAILRYFSGLEPEITDDIKPSFAAFLSWKDEYQVQPILTEHTVWSHEGGGYAGTLDLICWFKKAEWPIPRLYLVDFKTSSGFYDEMLMQVAAYRHAENPKGKTYADHIKGAGIVRLDKVTGAPEWKEYTDEECEWGYQRFLLLAEYFNLTHNRGAGENLSDRASFLTPPNPGPLFSERKDDGPNS